MKEYLILIRWSKDFTHKKVKYLIPFFLFFYFFKCESNGQAPDWAWAKSIGGADYDFGFSSASDDSGNIYITGYFNLLSDFDPGTAVFNLTSFGDADIFICKLNRYGYFIWAIGIGGTGDDEALSIMIGDSGNVLLTGTFSDTSDFDPGPGQFNLISQGNDDIFICKLDSSGNLIWAKGIGGPEKDSGISLGIDHIGNVYATGQYRGIVDFDPDTIAYFNLGSSSNTFGEVFILKLNPDGDFIWAKTFGGNNSEGNSITIDNSGNVCTTGYFTGTNDFNPDSSLTYNLTAAGGRDIFISKLNNTGNFIWAKPISGGGNYSEWSNLIKVDSLENIFLTGYFYGLTDFDTGPGIYFLSSAGQEDIFITKLDSAGNLIWAKGMGGTGRDHSRSLAIDITGNIYISGNFNAQIDLDPDSGVYNVTPVAQYDFYIEKLDPSGNFTWAKTIGELSSEGGISLSMDPLGNLVITGYFYSSTLSFSSTTLVNEDSSTNTSDIFIACLDTVLNTGNNQLINSNNTITLSPNPATSHFTICANQFYIDEINFYNNIGEKVLAVQTGFQLNSFKPYQAVLDVSKLSPGIYFVQVTGKNISEVKKLIIER